jgi:hypothetical protein
VYNLPRICEKQISATLLAGLASIRLILVAAYLSNFQLKCAFQKIKKHPNFFTFPI